MTRHTLSCSRSCYLICTLGSALKSSGRITAVNKHTLQARGDSRFAVRRPFFSKSVPRPFLNPSLKPTDDQRRGSHFRFTSFNYFFKYRLKLLLLLSTGRLLMSLFSELQAKKKKRKEILKTQLMVFVVRAHPFPLVYFLVATFVELLWGSCGTTAASQAVRGFVVTFQQPQLSVQFQPIVVDYFH